MKRIWILISVIAIVGIAISCNQQIQPTAEFFKSKVAFTATSSVASVSVSAKDSLTAVISFSWNDPKFSAGGLSQSTFTLMVSPTGTNFSNFASKSFAGVMTGSLLAKEINGMALKLGGTIGQVIKLDMKVVASLSNNTEQTNSNVLQIAVTPYGDLTLSVVNNKQTGAVFTWNTAFNGYSGVKTYQFQYAATGTNFAFPTSVSVTSFSQSYTPLALNLMALGLGTTPGSPGYVDFRVKASNELGTILYSNIVSDTITTYKPYNSIGIIGDGTPGGWNTDVDLYRPDPVGSPLSWTVTLYLKGGLSAKFRADDAWTTNWGASTWPTGTATQNGSNISVTTSGYYQVNFNSATGVYSFTLLTTPVYNQISVIGDATPGGWSNDTQLTQSLTNNQVWTGTVSLTAGGALKFRANSAWTTSWGLGTATPTGLSGWGTSNNGGNIPITTTGSYFIYFNAATGEFIIGNLGNNSGAGTPYNQIGIIGDGTPGGWNTDTFLIQNPANPFKWSGKVTLTAASAKFRANAAWTVNWGNSTFPNGVGTVNGSNIPVTAGDPQITFNSATGEYSFTY